MANKSKKDKKGKVMRKTISFTDDYEREFKHMNSHSNASLYICELIRRDLNNELKNTNSSDMLNDRVLEEKITKVMLGLLGGKVMIGEGVPTPNLPNNEDEFDDDIKDDIGDLFEM